MVRKTLKQDVKCIKLFTNKLLLISYDKVETSTITQNYVKLKAFSLGKLIFIFRFSIALPYL